LLPAVLRLVPEGEQGLLAAEFLSLARDLEDLVGAEERLSSFFGTVTNVQYAQRSRHSRVSGMKTFLE
jgi:hypothetical protein